MNPNTLIPVSTLNEHKGKREHQPAPRHPRPPFPWQPHHALHQVCAAVLRRCRVVLRGSSGGSPLRLCLGSPGLCKCCPPLQHLCSRRCLLHLTLRARHW